MTKRMRTQKKIVLALWLCVVAVALYTLLFHSPWIYATLTTLLGGNTIAAYIILLLLGSLRGFTLMPATILIVVGLLFMPALPLFIVIMAGVVISAISVFYFSEYLRLDTLFNKKHKKLLEKGRDYLNTYELPVITLWSMAPFLPTDVISYLAGTLKVNVYKFILGITLGESITCALYIWGGKAALHLFGIV